MNPICFYHSADLDGICSGAIAKKFIPDVELVGYDYGKPFPWERIRNRHVYMIDVSLPSDGMRRILDESSQFCWIDHHKSAIEECKEARLRIAGDQQIGKAGCELAWKWFTSQETPLAVHLLGRYDVWDHSDERTLPFQYGARLAIKNGVEDDSWYGKGGLLDPSEDVVVYDILGKGGLILEYQINENAKAAKTCAFDAELDGLKLIAANKPMSNSQLFDSVWDPEKYHAMCLFYLNKRGQWKISLYTTREDVDVSQIAKARGGGGHQKAAGFIADLVPLR